jgi:hypothetical protein
MAQEGDGQAGLGFKANPTGKMPDQSKQEK